jgi:hypothetical protein
MTTSQPRRVRKLVRGSLGVGALRFAALVVVEGGLLALVVRDRTALYASCHHTVATQRRSRRLLAYAAMISSAGSSTNTRPPELGTLRA